MRNGVLLASRAIVILAQVAQHGSFRDQVLNLARRYGDEEVGQGSESRSAAVRPIGRRRGGAQGLHTGRHKRVTGRVLTRSTQKRCAGKLCFNVRSRQHINHLQQIPGSPCQATVAGFQTSMRGKEENKWSGRRRLPLHCPPFHRIQFCEAASH